MRFSAACLLWLSTSSRMEQEAKQLYFDCVESAYYLVNTLAYMVVKLWDVRDALQSCKSLFCKCSDDVGRWGL